MFRRTALMFLTVILLVACSENGYFNRIALCDNKLTIEIPKDWSDKDSSPISIKYHNLRFDTIIFNKQAEAYMEIRVYDSSRNYYSDIGVFDIKDYLNNLMFYHTDSFALLTKYTIRSGNISLNVINFKFNNSESIKCYGSSVVFRTDINHNYELCLYSLKMEEKGFQEIAKRISNSIIIKP